MSLNAFIIGLTAYYIAIIITVCVHEFGHWSMAKICKLGVDGLRIQKFLYIIPLPTAVYVQVNEADLNNPKLFKIKHLAVSFSGIVAGTLPLGIYTYYQNSMLYSLIMFALYAMMCSKDFKEIFKLLRGKYEYEMEEMTVTIPESESECLSVYPKCETCGYHMLKECAGDKGIFPDKFKKSDLERLSKTIQERKAEFFKD